MKGPVAILGEGVKDAIPRHAFECLSECFAASQGASSLGMRAGSLPREASCLRLKSRLPDFLRQCPRLSDFYRFRVHRPLRRT